MYRKDHLQIINNISEKEKKLERGRNTVLCEIKGNFCDVTAVIVFCNVTAVTVSAFCTKNVLVCNLSN